MRNNREQYDRSYAAICKLIETGRVENASQMEAIVKQFHKTFVEKFRKKFLDGWYLFYSFRKKFIVFFANVYLRLDSVPATSNSCSTLFCSN